MENIYNIPDFQHQELDSEQRTETWHEDRKGKFTGSMMSDLMTCTASTSRMEWGRPEKIIDFGETAKKYVFSRAMERKTSMYLKRSIGFNGEYGKIVEPQIVKLYQEKYPGQKFESVGFLEFLPGIAGASPDGLIDYELGAEIKGAMSWNGVYERLHLPFDQKHKDFWQIQSEMLSLNVKQVVYIIGYPAKNLFNPIITDIEEKILNSSEIHQQAIIQRCQIGNNAIELFLNGVEFQESIRRACEEFEF